MKDLFCKTDCHHEGVVEEVKTKLPDEGRLYDLAELFKVFGDSTRIRILSCLQVREMCVCDVARVLGMTKSAVSHQLRCLRQAKLVKPRKSGKEVFYSLDDDHVAQIFECALKHIDE